jgi:hypothetical protein
MELAWLPKLEFVKRSNLMKKILLLILSSISLSTFAVDIYNNGQLLIPSVQVGVNTYTNVVVTLGSVVSIGNGAPNGFIDTYNLTTGQLTIPSVIVGSTTYSNVVITIGSVVTTGPFYNTIQNNSSAATSAVVTVGM